MPPGLRPAVEDSVPARLGAGEMASNEASILAALVTDHEKEILPEWIELQKRSSTLQTGRITEAELTAQSGEFLNPLRAGLASGADAANPAYPPVRQFLV